METEKILIERIMLITSVINQMHPELIPFLNEMPVTIPDDKNPKLNLVALKEYYDSLCILLKKYEIEHP